MKKTLTLALIDLSLLLLAFALTHLLNYRNFAFAGKSIQLFYLHLLIWLAVTLFSGKVSRLPRLSIPMGASLLAQAAVTSLFLLSLVIVGLHYTFHSRAMAYGTLVAFLILELAAFVSWQLFSGPIPHIKTTAPDLPLAANLSRRLFLVDFVAFLLAFTVAEFFFHGYITLTLRFDRLLIQLGLWLGSSLASGKFRGDNLDGFDNALGAVLRSALFMAAGLALFVFLFRLEVPSLAFVFEPILFLTVLEIPLFWLYCSYRKNKNITNDIEDTAEVATLIGQVKDQPLLKPASKRTVTDPAREKLRHALEFLKSGMFEFLEKYLDLEKIDRADCVLLSTDNLFNLEVLEEEGSRLIVNLHKINDVRWFNRYFLLAHRKLQTDGYLVGMAQTPTTHLEYYRQRYPHWLAACFYGGNFLWRRVFP